MTTVHNFAMDDAKMLASLMLEVRGLKLTRYDCTGRRVLIESDTPDGRADDKKDRFAPVRRPGLYSPAWERGAR
ncbi:MAG: hypothetical protein KIS65_08460 [Nitrosomonas sp.]|nr:hypothetical protein [Nitrosomonas sp.]